MKCLSQIIRFSFPILLGLIMLTLGCRNQERPKPTNPHILYSFFVAGHTYGHPGSKKLGFHPPFKAKFPLINSTSTMEFGVLTGDMVRLPTVKAWDAIDRDLRDLFQDIEIPDTSFESLEDIDLIKEEEQLPVHFVAGNHDMINRPLFDRRYGDTYYHFFHRNDLFIVLDASLNNWNIEGEQLAYLKGILDSEYPKADRIFVFFHQQLWFHEQNIFRYVRPNSFAGRADSMNFWTEIEPMFHTLDKQVVMFAGDAGALTYRPSFMYYNYDNMTFISSGMGDGIKDNFIIVDVMSDKSIQYRLIALNGDDIDALGQLEDFILP